MTEQHAKPKEEPRRKRRWLRYSLRTFLLLLTVFSVWLGLLVNRVHKQKGAVDWVKEMGGTVSYDFQWDPEQLFPMHPDTKPPGPDWLRELIGVDYFANVVLVNLTDTHVSDITPLQDLPHLQSLSLRGSPVSEIKPLSDLTELDWVDLSDTTVSDLGPLVGMKITMLGLSHDQQITVPKELENVVTRW